MPVYSGVVVTEKERWWIMELLYMRRDASAVDSGVVVTEEERQCGVVVEKER